MSDFYFQRLIHNTDSYIIMPVAVVTGSNKVIDLFPVIIILFPVTRGLGWGL